jgi:CBS domain containing-hemolysin-like protein
MTPSAKILGVQKDTQADVILKNEQGFRYSRLPIFGEDLDDIIGVIHRYKLIDAFLKNQAAKKVADFSSSIYFISQHASVSNALNEFIKTKQHIFIVIDAYGSTAGLISLEDCIESLLGEEIMDEFDKKDPIYKRI